MNRIRLNTAVFGLFMVMVLLNSCESVLTTSWGKSFKRDPKSVKVTTSNVEDLLKNARGDPELSRAIFDKTTEKIKTASGKEKAVLQSAAITAAKQGAALDTTIMTNIGTILNSDSTDLEGPDGLLSKVLDGTDNETASKISKALAGAFISDDAGKSDIYVPPKKDPSDPAELEQGPHFKPGSPFYETASESDLVNLIMIIVVGKAAENDGTMEDYLDKWGNPDIEDSKYSNVAGSLDDEEKVAVAAYYRLGEKNPDNEFYKSLRNILESGNEE
jgi:hypothetical protein